MHIYNFYTDHKLKIELAQPFHINSTFDNAVPWFTRNSKHKIIFNKTGVLQNYSKSHQISSRKKIQINLGIHCVHVQINNSVGFQLQKHSNLVEELNLVF